MIIIIFPADLCRGIWVDGFFCFSDGIVDNMLYIYKYHNKIFYVLCNEDAIDEL